MSKKKVQISLPSPNATPTPSYSNSPQDKLNEKLLQLRLKHEEEIEQKHLEQKEKEKSKKVKSQPRVITKSSSLPQVMKPSGHEESSAKKGAKALLAKSLAPPPPAQILPQSTPQTTVITPKGPVAKSPAELPQDKILPQSTPIAVIPESTAEKSSGFGFLKQIKNTNFSPTEPTPDESKTQKEPQTDIVETFDLTAKPATQTIPEKPANSRKISKKKAKPVQKSEVVASTTAAEESIQIADVREQKAPLETVSSKEEVKTRNLAENSKTSDEPNGQESNLKSSPTVPSSFQLPGDVAMMLEHSDQNRLSQRPIAIFRAGSLDATKTIRGFPQRLIPSKPKQKVNESLFDVLKSAKDEARHITIIPADEAKILKVELSQWKSYRMTFLVLCGLDFLMGIMIVMLTCFSSLSFYVFRKSKEDVVIDFLMHTDTMIISTVFLSSCGILVFRLLPSTKLQAVIRIHVTIFTGISLLFLFAFIIGFIYHQKITGINEHMYTLHAFVGVMIVGFLIWEITTGVYIMYYPSEDIIKYHGAVGMMTFMLCGACCVSGYLVRANLFTGTLHQQSDMKTAITNTTGVLIILFCCLTRYLATEFRFRRRARPEWDAVFARSITSFDDQNIDREGCTLQQYVRRNLRQK